MSKSDPDTFQLLETMLWRPRRGFYLLNRHIARLRRSARYFGFRLVSPTALRNVLESAIIEAASDAALKVRLLVDVEGQCSVTVAPMPPKPAVGEQPWRIAVARTPVDGENPFLRHKTTHRTVYESARAAHPEADDVLLWNRHGKVTETTVANIVFDFGDGIWLTPAAECGLLPGIYREYLLAAGRMREAVIPLDDIFRKRPAWCLMNSVRRLIPATPFTDNPRDVIGQDNRPD